MMWHIANIIVLLLGAFDWWSTSRIIAEFGTAGELNPLWIPLMDAGLFTPIKFVIHIFFFLTALICLKKNIYPTLIKVSLFLGLAEYLYIVFNNGQIVLWM